MAQIGGPRPAAIQEPDDMRTMTMRIALAALPLLLAIGCAAPQPSGVAAPARAQPGIAAGVAPDGRGAACGTDLQSCDRNAPCCAGLVCQPNGRFGQLCQRPWP